MNNLERLVCAMGFERINPESLTAIRDFVGDPPKLGKFTTLATKHGLSALIGTEAKSEYLTLLGQGAIMFAPAAQNPVPFGLMPNDSILSLNMIIAIRAMIEQMDESQSDSEGHYPALDAGCNDCTMGCTPMSADTGPCGYHRGKSVLAAWERRMAVQVATPAVAPVPARSEPSAGG